MNEIKYRFSPTLLDSYLSYLEHEEIWAQYWGKSDNPKTTLQEFQQEKFQGLIDKINRVDIPWEDTELMDRGTAFNEIIDSIIENRMPEDMTVTKVFRQEEIPNPNYSDTSAYTSEFVPMTIKVDTKDLLYLDVSYNKRVFRFDARLCKQIAKKYKGALTQVFIEGTLPTRYGDVRFVGYIDEMMPNYISDLKTTTSYTTGKFRGNMQHLVYPLMIEQMTGQVIDYFVYDVVEFGKYEINCYEEVYPYRREEAQKRLTEVCEEFIRFVEDNRELITDKKIFNEV